MPLTSVETRHMCPLFPLLFPRAPWVMGRVQLSGHSTGYLSPMVYSHMTAILFPISCCPISSQCCVLLTSSAPQGFSLFSLILMASLSAKCCCSTTLSAPATSPKPVYSCITLSLSNSVKGYMLCIFHTTAVSGTLLSAGFEHDSLFPSAAIGSNCEDTAPA